jgi:hypothetical protein
LSPADDDPGATGRDDPRGALERWVLPYFEDSTLWPVLLVVLAAIAAFLAPVLASAVRDRHLLSIVAAAVAMLGSLRLVVWEWRVRRRPGGIGVALIVIWGLAAVAAWYGAQGGLL